MIKKITPHLWFDTQAEDAANFYCSIFKDAAITSTQRLDNTGPNEDSTVLIVTFRLEDQNFIAMNAGPEFKFNESISFVIDCDDQAEVDYFWERLIADGGQESQCGWLKDKFGLSWQVVPRQLNEILADPDPIKAQRAMHAMMQMKKLSIPDLLAARDQES